MIVGNWKMNPSSLEEAKGIFSSVSKRAGKAGRVTVVIAPPAVFLKELSKKKSDIHLSAQDVSEYGSGAFTGSISAAQVLDAGAEYAIIGHSERRAAGDTDEMIAKKTGSALKAGLRVILCVGEKERDGHAHYLESVREQILKVLSAIDKKLAKNIVIAYEPVWAIGKSYNSALGPADIHGMSIFIRKVAAEVVGKKDGLKVPVLYGGSVDFENAKSILKDALVDGLLVGRQSLDAKAFSSMIEYANSL